MEVNAHLWKRQTGKTFKLVNDFLVSPDDSFIIVYSMDMRSCLLKEYDALKDYKDQIFSSTQGPDKVRGWRIVHLYVDEYYYIDNINEIIEITSPTLHEGSLNIYSSLNNLSEVDFTIFAMIRSWKEHGLSLKSVLKYLKTDEIKDLVSKHWEDYITEPNTNFISHPNRHNNEDLGIFHNYGKG